MNFLNKEPSTVAIKLSRRVMQLSVSNHRRQAIPDVRKSVIAIHKFMFSLSYPFVFCRRKAIYGSTIFVLKCLM